MPIDALKDWEPKGGGLFLRVNSSSPATIRVLTLDPLVSTDKWGGTKYAFTIWNWTENKAQIWQTTPGVLKMLTSLHRDDDWDDLNKIDIKVSATGELLETRYAVTPMPKAQEMTQAMLDEAKLISLEEKIENSKGRLSKYDSESESEHARDAQSGYEKAKEARAKLPEDEADVTDEDLSDEVDLNSIPF